ncbi:Transglutaminase-like superfamily protein [Nakamurella panacisegetis]|uniref:Transglutaminase-like superfamily protein n=1 Tax=Nakamurella panacisegetis TaxID=1090615 RepID=A0A1H0PB98_9ACTN|nr:transglutaminase domain-containing protein [Nakamurella panacisegetis]SDP02030.1 Transglutaminase-like superfamily protein [Nakamurella panacisegetis]
MTAYVAGRPATRSGRRASATLVLAVGIAALVVAGSLALQPAYGGQRWLVAAVGGAATGALVAWGAARLALPWFFSVLGLVVAYLLFGAALATPSVAAGGIAPTLESTRLLVLGVVTSWRQALTVAVPVGSSGALLVPVFLSTLVLSHVGATIAVRTRRPLFALLAPTVMLAVAALMGTSDSHLPLVSGGVLAVGGLILASAVGVGDARLNLRKPVSGILVLAAAVAAVLFAGGPTAPGSPRVALRTYVNPPFDPQTYPSPLSGFRNYVGSDEAKKVKLFSISGLPDDVDVRLAALDSYDGVAFGVTSDTGAFARVGDKIAESVTGTQVSAHLTVQGYQGVYLPTAGHLTGIEFSGDRAATLTEAFRYATGSAVGVEPDGLRPGDTYDFTALVPADPTDGQMASAAVDNSTGIVAPAKIPDAARTAATKYTGAVDGAYAKAKAMADGLKAAGHLSHGSKTETRQSPSGHGIDRLTRLLTDPQMIGDQEQFAPALSMMLWSQGIPNRVVMGFATGKHGTAPVTVTGGDVTAWVEVPFAGVGWVSFDPTPDQNSQAPQPIPRQSAPKPQVVQPPPPPPPPGQAKTSEVDQSQSSDKNPDDNKKNDPPPPGSAASGFWWAIGLGAGGLMLLIAAGVALILWLKARRRARRRNAPAPPDRISGGWNQVLDEATDFGWAVPDRRTRSEAAADLDERFATGTVLLAREADARVFGPDAVDDEQAARFWTEVDAALLGLQTGHGRWRRLRARVSIASLRREDGRR